MKKNKGITLVALIITIIIMLILVAVTVSVVIKTNLIGTADKTTQRYKEEQEREGNLNNVKANGKDLDEYLKLIEKDQNDDNDDDSKYPTIKAGKIATQVSNYNGAIVPTGYTVSNISSEQTLSEGIVIYNIPSNVDSTAENFWTETDEDGFLKVQTSYDQFVWVPVQRPYVTTEELDTIITKAGTNMTQTQALQTLADNNIYPMAVQYKEQVNGKEVTHYRGVLYTPTLNGNSIKFAVSEISTTDDYTTVEYLREPAFLSDESSGDVGNTIGITQDSLQEKYDSMMNSIKETGGFWVARYELNDYSKRNKEPLNETWYDLYSKCSNYSTSNATGTMITDSQWDQIMIWMKDVKNKEDASKFYLFDSSNMGNYVTENTASPKSSGASDEYKVKNIFDMAGNYIENTTAAAANLLRIKRGNDFGNTGDSGPVSAMSTNDNTGVNGTRITLIINN